MNGSVPFAPPLRLPFDRYQRYMVAARAIAAWQKHVGPRRLRVLEVGANAHRDLEHFVSGADIIYLDQAVVATAEAARFVQGDGCAVPFADRSFDVVLALDVLEHVAPGQRAAFLAEMIRVAAGGIIVAAPFRSAEIAAVEEQLNGYFRDLHGHDFVWLAEHAEHGLPDLDDTTAALRRHGWNTAVWGGGNLALWAKLMRAHFYVNSEPDLLDLRAEVDAFYNRTLAEADCRRPVYRHFITAAAQPQDLAVLATAQSTRRARSQNLLRLQEHLDRLYEVGHRQRGRRARAALAAGAEATAAYGAASAALEARHVEIETLRRERARLVADVAAREAQAAALDADGRQKDAALAAALAELGARRRESRGRAVAARLVRSLRRLWSLARAASRIWRSRLHAMRLEPVHDVWRDREGFRSRGDDPQLLLRSTRRRPPCGWVEISFVIEMREQWPSPKLYIDGGRGFSEAESFSLPVRAGGRVESTVCLPPKVHALRLDPLAAPGRFVLRDVRIREIGLLQVAATLLPYVRAAVLRPRDVSQLVATGIAILRGGAGRLLTHSLLARDREVSDYPEWIAAYDTLSDTDRELIRRHIAALPQPPLVSILMPTYETPEPYLRAAIESVRRQLYPHWELCIADDGSAAPHVRRTLDEYTALDARIRVVYRGRRGHISAASNSALEMARGEFVALLDHDDELAEHALYHMAVEIDAHPAAEMLYSDEDKITVRGERFHPYFKPDWNPELFLAQNLVTHLCVCRTAQIRAAGGFRVGYEGAQDWDVVMRIAERVPGQHIRHVPHILYHWRAVPGSTALAIGEKSYASTAQYRTLHAHFARLDEPVEISPIAGLCWRIRHPLPDPEPLVTVIIPTRDRGALLQRCVAGLRERGGCARVELIIVDNRSSERATLEYLAELAAQPEVTVLPYDAPFNYSAINNFGARHARGDVLVFLNNDVEAISNGWLAEMVSQSCRQQIGAVGAMLYYPNDTIQHAGVILGHGTSGIAAHAYAHRPRGYAGQVGRALLAQNVSAVTAACLAVRRRVFEDVGGFDEAQLRIAYNDLDLCLRIAARGYRNLWTPYAELYHHESASRGYEDTPAKRARFQQEIDCVRRRWGAALLSDPAYNPNLSLEGESFTLAFPPRTTKPWLAITLDEAPEAGPVEARA